MIPRRGFFSSLGAIVILPFVSFLPEKKPTERVKADCNSKLLGFEITLAPPWTRFHTSSLSISNPTDKPINIKINIGGIDREGQLRPKTKITQTLKLGPDFSHVTCITMESIK